MPTDQTLPDPGKKLRLHTILSVLVIVLGVVLLTYMVVVESEPGALPLGLTALGIGWYVVTRRRRSLSR